MPSGSGPAISTTAFRAGAVTTSARCVTTSVQAIGCNRPGVPWTVSPTVAASAMPGTNSKNWVERTMVNGSGPACTSCSWATLARR